MIHSRRWPASVDTRTFLVVRAWFPLWQGMVISSFELSSRYWLSLAIQCSASFTASIGGTDQVSKAHRVCLLRSNLREARDQVIDGVACCSI